MEMALSMGMFEALEYDEMLAIDGGGIWDAAGVAANAYALGEAACYAAGKVGGVAVCAAIAANPVVVATGAVCAGVGLIYGGYKLIKG